MAGLLSVKVETKKFNSFIARYAKQSKEGAGVIVRKLAFMVLQKIILKWPVKTGRSRSGWGMACRLLGMTIPPEPDPVEAAKGADPGTAMLVTQGAVVGFVATNGVDYAEALEKGWSAQAPLGAVRISMLEVKALLGGGELPEWIRGVYRTIWDALGQAEGTEIRGGKLGSYLSAFGESMGRGSPIVGVQGGV